MFKFISSDTELKRNSSRELIELKSFLILRRNIKYTFSVSNIFSFKEYIFILLSMEVFFDLANESKYCKFAMKLFLINSFFSPKANPTNNRIICSCKRNLFNIEIK